MSMLSIALVAEFDVTGPSSALRPGRGSPGSDFKIAGKVPADARMPAAVSPVETEAMTTRRSLTRHWVAALPCIAPQSMEDR
jgi:hypothetical protein